MCVFVCVSQGDIEGVNAEPNDRKVSLVSPTVSTLNQDHFQSIYIYLFINQPKENTDRYKQTETWLLIDCFTFMFNKTAQILYYADLTTLSGNQSSGMVSSDWCIWANDMSYPVQWFWWLTLSEYAWKNSAIIKITIKREMSYNLDIIYI